VVDHVLLSHQVRSWSLRKYSKNKVFISIMTWPNLDLWPWPLSFGMMITNPQVHIYANDDDPSMENKKVWIFMYNSVFTLWRLNDVITSTFFLLIWKALIKGFHIWYGTVCYRRFQNLNWDKQFSTCSKNHEGHGRSAPKINPLSGRPYATLTTSLELIW
jgi:hypothetical protein